MRLGLFGAPLLLLACLPATAAAAHPVPTAFETALKGCWTKVVKRDSPSYTLCFDGKSGVDAEYVGHQGGAALEGMGLEGRYAVRGKGLQLEVDGVDLPWPWPSAKVRCDARIDAGKLALSHCVGNPSGSARHRLDASEFAAAR